MNVVKSRKEMLMEAYEYLRENCRIHTKKEFAEALNYGQASLYSAMGGNEAYLTDKLFAKICATFPNTFNLDYFLTGKGNMLIDRIFCSNVKKTYPCYIDEPMMAAEEITPSYSKGKPYYNVDFRCGFDILMNCQTTNPDYLIDFQPYNDCDLYCNAHGDSMHPTISSGDIVALKRIEDFRYLINGEIYAIVTSNGMRTIKRIRDNGDTFTLIADNQAISDQTIPKSLVTHAFLVRGSIKMF